MHRFPKLSGSALICATLLLAPSTGRVAAQQPPRIDAATRSEVIDTVARLMTDHYVFPDVGERMGEHIRAKHARGEYDRYAEVEEFCGKVTEDLREICRDRHVFVFYSPEEAREVAARNGLLPAEETERIRARQHELERRSNFGFGKVEILDGNVGYLHLSSFSGDDDACLTAVGALAFLASSDAVIIDLRGNGGGGGPVHSLLMSYFFDSEKVELSGAYFRKRDAIEQSWTLPFVPGKRMPGVPLYILTDARTFSAAEGFGYSLQQLGRATIVGERTKGGAHPVDVMIVKGDILTQISIGNSVNPITGTNWEGEGVEPDVETAGDGALRAAHLLALRALIETTDDPEVERELAALIEALG